MWISFCFHSTLLPFVAACSTPRETIDLLHEAMHAFVQVLHFQYYVKFHEIDSNFVPLVGLLHWHHRILEYVVVEQLVYWV